MTREELMTLVASRKAAITARDNLASELEGKMNTLRDSITNLGTPTLSRLLSLLATIKSVLGID